MIQEGLITGGSKTVITEMMDDGIRSQRLWFWFQIRVQRKYNNNCNSKNSNNYVWKSHPLTAEMWNQMPVVEKNFYTPFAVTKNRSNIEIKKFLTDNIITIIRDWTHLPHLTWLLLRVCPCWRLMMDFRIPFFLSISFLSLLFP